MINKQRNRIKIFKPFEDISKSSPTIKAMAILYACVYKRSSKPIIKGSRVESIEDARKEYKQLLEEGWKKTSIYRIIFKHNSPLSNVLRNNLERYIHCNSKT